MVATGDFDGDGLPDEAYFVRRGDAYALVLARSAAKAPRVLAFISDPSRVGLRTLPPGKYTAWCARRFAEGGSDCLGGELRELITKHDAIWAIWFGAASTVTYWDDGRIRSSTMRSMRRDGLA